MILEGVPYTRYRIYYTVLTPEPKRRRMVRWFTPLCQVRDIIARELVGRFGLDGIAPGSVTVRPW